MNRASFMAESSIDHAHEWLDLTCDEYDRLLAGDEDAKVASSCTDQSGQYGEPVIFTLWQLTNGDYLAGRIDNPGKDYATCFHSLAKPTDSGEKL